MRILGLKKTSLVDYPGKVASVIFLGGCNFRCPFCHNPGLVANKGEEISKSEVIAFLKKRSALIDGVCITGGEPTIHKGLLSFMREIKGLGLLVKLDTNGSNPEMLQKAIKQNIVDYAAMDIKSSLGSYNTAAGTSVETNKIMQSIEILKSSGIDYEFRTTMLPKLVNETDFSNICAMLKGSRKLCIQQFERSNELLDSSFKTEKAYTEEALKAFADAARPYVKRCEIRNL